MQAADEIKSKVKELLSSDEIDEVVGWKTGEFCYDESPSFFTTPDEVDKEFVYDDFSAANLSKYMINESLKTKKVGDEVKDIKIAVLLKPCDTYSFVQLLTEHRIKRENVHVVGIPCGGKIDFELIDAMGIKGVTGVESKENTVIVHTIYGDKEVPKEDVILEKCKVCKGTKHMIYDELCGCTEEDEMVYEDTTSRFKGVEAIENMTPDEKFKFWQDQLSKCIRCNACRNVCPACSCRTCVFDNMDSQISAKANTTSFEEQCFHFIRAFHVAGRCTDCGECSRVCPEHIPLHLLNRKFIKDIDKFYGDYQAGEEEGQRAPLVNFNQDTDIEPNDGGSKK